MKMNKPITLNKEATARLKETLSRINTLGEEFKGYFKQVWYNPISGEMFYDLSEESRLEEIDGDFMAIAEITPEKPSINMPVFDPMPLYFALAARR